MDVSGGLLAIDKRHDVRMVKFFQNVDLRVEVLLELLVQFLQVDRLDGD